MGGGINETLTATPSDVMKGYKFVGLLQDDIEIGTLELTGNALVNHVLKNQTFYTTNPKEINIGTMEVNNISNFSLNLVSGRNITAKWTNPIQTTGRPYSGVYIRYQTGTYPTSTTGTQAYKGLGSSSSAGAVSQVNLSLPSLNTTYYFIIYSYCVTNNGELLGNQLRATINTGSTQIVTITSSQNYTIPLGYNLIDVFCVGGGNGGDVQYNGPYGQPYDAGAGGGGGYTATRRDISVSPGQVIAAQIGGSGSPTSFGSYCSSNGGGHGGSSANGGNGGSGGGGRGKVNGLWNPATTSGSGGTDGNNGGNGANTGGRGQGSTTRAFGESGGTLYGGGGAGGQGGGFYTDDGHDYWIFYEGGSAGGGGGGNKGQNGGVNTGGGGGGANRGYDHAYWPTPGGHGAGGSGVVLVRLK